MNLKRIFLIPALLGSSCIFSSYEAAPSEEPRHIVLLRNLNGEWNFQAWWKIEIVVVNAIDEGIGEFRLYCLNTDDIMEGRLKYNGVMIQDFENRLGGTWSFNVSTSGQDSGLAAGVYDI